MMPAFGGRTHIEREKRFWPSFSPKKPRFLPDQSAVIANKKPDANKKERVTVDFAR